MRRDAHYGTRPIVGQDIVPHPDRNPFSIERVPRKSTRRDAVLLDCADIPALARSLLLLQQLLDLRSKRPILCGKRLGHRMLRRKLNRGRAKDRIHSRRENRNLLRNTFHGEVDQRAIAAPDPVALHCPDLLRPSLQLVQALQQLLRILCNSQKPLRQVALIDNLLLVSPAAPTHHLLIRQHRLALWTPVHLALLPIRQPRLEHLQEDPLIPLVVVRQAGRHLRRPVVAQPHTLHLLAHSGYIVQRPLTWRRIVLQRGILRRQAERVPSHRVQHVVSPHPHVPSQCVPNRIVPNMTHVQLAARVRQHLQAVVLRLPAVDRLRSIQFRIRVPTCLPPRLNLRW